MFSVSKFKFNFFSNLGCGNLSRPPSWMLFTVFLSYNFLNISKNSLICPFFYHQISLKKPKNTVVSGTYSFVFFKKLNFNFSLIFLSSNLICSVILWWKFVQTPLVNVFIVFLRKNVSNITKKNYYLSIFLSPNITEKNFKIVYFQVSGTFFCNTKVQFFKTVNTLS